MIFFLFLSFSHFFTVIKLEESYLENSIIIILLACFSVFFAFVFILFFILNRCCPSLLSSNFNKPAHFDSLNLVESPSTKTSVTCFVDFENLKIDELIGNGRYGAVWKAQLDDQTVAVKIFPSNHKQYFINELDIYQLPLMEHPSILQFYGAEERKSINNPLSSKCYLVLSYASNGCLQDFLKYNTIDWSTMCKMIQSIASGLAHLHSELRVGDRVKPCISHRDLSSRNILVKEDLSCALCDFGFSIKISGLKCNGLSSIEQTLPLTDVGTLRFMAPEILEGAVNLRDCESFLKQTDVYALGLIMWEIATRCSDLYQGIKVPDYKQPFELEIGSHPTYEQMQVLVTKHKARPLFPGIWKDSNPAIRSLKETIEDCWDHDAEARLTALCVEERVSELPILWKRHKIGTINTIDGHQTVANIAKRNSFPLRNGNLSFTESCNKENIINTYNSLGNNERIADTIILPSNDSEKNLTFSGNFQTPRVSLPLQPYQGRNPCLERNLMHETSDESNSGGVNGKYLQQGFKFRNKNDNYAILDGCSNELENILLIDQDSSVREERGVTIPRRVINNPTPIILVQNEINVSMPKQQNVPGNGHHTITSNLTHNNSSNIQSNSWPSRLFKQWTKTGQNLRHLFARRKQTEANKEGDNLAEKEPLSSRRQECNQIVSSQEDTSLMISSQAPFLEDKNEIEKYAYQKFNVDKKPEEEEEEGDDDDDDDDDDDEKDEEEQEREAKNEEGGGARGGKDGEVYKDEDLREREKEKQTFSQSKLLF